MLAVKSSREVSVRLGAMLGFPSGLESEKNVVSVRSRGIIEQVVQVSLSLPGNSPARPSQRPLPGIFPRIGLRRCVHMGDVLVTPDFQLPQYGLERKADFA